MEQIRAVVVDPSATGRLVIRPVPAPSLLPAETLVRLVVAGALRPPIEVEASWTDIASVAQSLYNRGIPGKAVLHFRLRFQMYRERAHFFVTSVTSQGG